MLVIPYFDPDSCTFSYLVVVDSQAAIIDPVLGFDPASGRTDTEIADRQLAELQHRGLALRWILETHAHADHLSGAQYLKSECKGSPRVVIGRGICEVQQRFKAVYNLGEDFATDGSQFDQLVADGDVLDLGGQSVEVMATPGHTGDSVSYRIDHAVFIGDTLFRPDCGTARCDFPGGDAGLLYDSIQRLHGLPGHTRIYLCHDYPAAGQDAQCETSVAASRSGNVHANETIDRDRFIAMRTERDAQLQVPRLILPAIQVNIRAGHLPAPEENGVRYLKLPLDPDLATLTAL